jgi:hypothetical protein
VSSEIVSRNTERALHTGLARSALPNSSAVVAASSETPWRLREFFSCHFSTQFLLLVRLRCWAWNRSPPQALPRRRTCACFGLTRFISCRPPLTRRVGQCSHAC